MSWWKLQFAFIAFPSLCLANNLTGLTAFDAFDELNRGNLRHLRAQEKFGPLDEMTRNKLVEGQSPHTACIACSDSRVTPEIVFDQGPGSIFSVRGMGNAVDEVSRGSVEFAVTALKTRLILILGHEGCGAVDCALRTSIEERPLDSSMHRILDLIRPHIEIHRENPDKYFRDAVKSNIEGMGRRLVEGSPILRKLFETQDLFIAYGIFSIKTGKVDFFYLGRGPDRDNYLVSDSNSFSCSGRVSGLAESLFAK